jgi:hypothetical protein
MSTDISEVRAASIIIALMMEAGRTVPHVPIRTLSSI